jgi:hypothetical protein
MTEQKIALYRTNVLRITHFSYCDASCICCRISDSVCRKSPIARRIPAHDCEAFHHSPMSLMIRPCEPGKYDVLSNRLATPARKHQRNYVLDQFFAEGNAVPRLPVHLAVSKWVIYGVLFALMPSLPLQELHNCKRRPRKILTQRYAVLRFLTNRLLLQLSCTLEFEVYFLTCIFGKSSISNPDDIQRSHDCPYCTFI